MIAVPLEDEYGLAIAAVAAGRELVVAERAAGVLPRVVDATAKELKISTDTALESRIVKVLKDGSSHSILAEESSSGRSPAASGLRWVVDPLDGSANYLRRIPLCCIAIALLLDNEPVVGVILDLQSGDLYSCVVGAGAWIGTPDDPRAGILQVRRTSEPASAILATGLPAERDFNDSALTSFLPWFRQFKKVRMFGTAGLSLAFLAAGRVDAYGEDDIKLWDVAAGIALVRAAGGHVTAVASNRVPFGLSVRAAGSRELWSRVDSGSHPSAAGEVA